MPQGNPAPKADDKTELDLRAIIDASPRLDELSAARVICQVATSVHAAKGGGKPTELSPEAIAINADGTINVELGKLVLGYSSPEKIKNLSIDRRSDVFSLGVVMWEALTHERLFEGTSDDAIGKAVTDGEIKPPSELNANVPAELDAICKKALARDPADRYHSPKVMAAEIEAVLDDASYPDDNSRLASFVQKALAQKPTLPAPKVAPKLTTPPPGSMVLPSIVARAGGTTPPLNAPTLPGMPSMKPATIPPPIASTLPAAAPIAPAPPVLPAGSAENLRSTVIGTPIPPGLEELAKTTPFARDAESPTPTPEPASTGMIAGLGAMPGLEPEPPKPVEVPTPAPLKIEPTPVVPVEAAGAHHANHANDFDDEPKNPADVVSLGHQDVLAKWAWQTGSMEAIHDDHDDHHHHHTPNRKLLLYAVGGALGLALIVIIIAVASGGSKKAEQPIADKPAEFKPSLAAGTDPAPTPTPEPAKVEPTPTPTPTPTPPTPPTPAVKAVEPTPTPTPVAAIEPPKPPTPTPEIKKVDPPKPPEIKKPEIKKPEIKKPEPKKVETKKVETKKPEPKKVATGPIDPYAEAPKKIDPAEAYRTGLQQYARGDTTGALATFKASMAANSGYAPTYRGLGLVYEKLGNHAMARASFKRYLALAPSASDADNIRERMEKL